MTKPFIIRRLLASDLEDYRNIRLEALRNEPESFGSTYGIEASRPLTEHATRIASSAVFGAYADETIVGMIGFKQEDGPKDAHKGFVWGFYVRPENRRQGVGADLISALIGFARDSVEQLTLTVVQGNDAAVSLYKRFGFDIYGIEPKALKSTTGYSDEVLMILFL